MNKHRTSLRNFQLHTYMYKVLQSVGVFVIVATLGPTSELVGG